MINYELTEKEKKLQQDMAAFCAGKIAPMAKTLDESPRDKVGTLVLENLKKIADAGLLGVEFNEGKIDLISHYVAAEELAKACASTYLSARSSVFLCGGLLELFGTKDQKIKYVSKLKSVKIVGALAYSESDAGTDLAGITTLAKKEGDTWVLNGVKDIVVNAPIADIILVLAYSDKNAGPEKGMSLFVVEKNAKGLKIGKSLETMGLRGAPTAMVTLENCIAKEIVGGEAGKAYAQINHVLEIGRLGVAALCIGIGVACMEKSTEYTKGRKVAGKPLGTYQEIGFKLADMFTKTDIGRVLSLRAAWGFNTGDAEAGIIAACARLFACEAVTQIANLAMQVFASHGYMKGTDIERLYRDARIGEIYEGTTELQRVIIAKSELDKFLPA